jgi:two-component system sensor histidine kinase HydH
MGEGGRLTLTARQHGRLAEIVVADTGTGIGEADLARIFEPFYTTKARGSGLGLAICKKIVEEAGGTIAVASEPGKGTTFTVTLPLAGGSKP